MNFKTFKTLTRMYTLPMSTIPYLVGFFAYLAINIPFVFNVLLNGIIGFLGVSAAHLFANLFDDYIDIKKQLNLGIPLNEINFKSKRKARAILNGDATMDDAKKVLIWLGILAALTALYFISITRSPIIFYYIIPTVILTLFYPLSSKYGLSETVIGIIFGPLLIHGFCHVLTGSPSYIVFLISIASGIITSILAITQGIMDYEFDEPTGKKSLPVIIKDKKASIGLIAGLIAISYIITFATLSSSLILGTLLALVPILLSLAIGIKLISSLNEYINIKDVQFVPKWYFGFMENWEEIKANNFCFYMYRFYLARNLAISFNIGLLAVALFYAMLKTPFLLITPALFF